MDPALHDLTIRPPAVDDAPAVLDLLIACDIAEYGVPDSSLEDLRHEWTLLNLEQDAWLVFTPENKLVGYAAVFKDGARFSFDFYTHPAYDEDELQDHLLARCEGRACVQMAEALENEAAATSIVAQVDEAGRRALEKAGFVPQKYFFRMQIELDTLPSAPVWPEGYTLRTAVAEQDDRMIYEFIQVAFAQPGRTRPSFERWQGFMMRPDHFESDLWFLLFDGKELIGAALCYDYPEFGWVRQLGVAPARRRQGIGSALLRHAFRVFFQRGHKKVALGTDSERPQAQALYENVGMKCVRRYDEYYKALRGEHCT